MQHADKEEERCELCELECGLGEQILLIAQDLLTRRVGDSGTFTLHYSNTELGLAQSFVILITPATPAERIPNVPGPGTIQ